MVYYDFLLIFAMHCRLILKYKYIIIAVNTPRKCKKNIGQGLLLISHSSGDADARCKDNLDLFDLFPKQIIIIISSIGHI